MSDLIAPTPDLEGSPVSPTHDIPSVVSVGQSHQRIKLLGFIVFMMVLAFVVTRSSTPKTPALVPLQEPSFEAPPLPPAMVKAMTRNRSQIDRDVSGQSEWMVRESALLDVRRKSPMVIFNKNQTAAGPGSTFSGLNRGGFTPGGLSSADKELEGGSPSSVPLPMGFNPSVAVSAHATALGDRDFIIAQGKQIEAVLETAVHSDHPGLLRALISHDVYGDSGRTILLPRGSRLVGQYDSGVTKGQNRVFVYWERAIRPDGIDIQLGSAGTDSLGRTGLEGHVNNHFMAMFGAATLLSVIGSAASTVGVNPADQNNSLAQYRQSVTGGFNSAAGTVLGQFVQIKPTITVNQGERINVFVARDLYFDSELLSGTGARWVP